MSGSQTSFLTQVLHSTASIISERERKERKKVCLSLPPLLSPFSTHSLSPIQKFSKCQERGINWRLRFLRYFIRFTSGFMYEYYILSLLFLSIPILLPLTPFLPFLHVHLSFSLLHFLSLAVFHSFIFSFFPSLFSLSPPLSLSLSHWKLSRFFKTQVFLIRSRFCLGRVRLR